MIMMNNMLIKDMMGNLRNVLNLILMEIFKMPLINIIVLFTNTLNQSIKLLYQLWSLWKNIRIY